MLPRPLLSLIILVPVDDVRDVELEGAVKQVESLSVVEASFYFSS